MIEGQAVIVCGGRSKAKFCLCGHKAIVLCDWKVAERKSGTCDKPLCLKHAKEVAAGKHLCPFHQLQYDSWKRRHPEKTIAVEVQQQLFQQSA